MKPPDWRSLDRWTLGVIAGVLVIAVAALVSALLAKEPVQDLTTPEGVVIAYIQDIQNGRPDAAWDLLAPEATSGSPGGPKPLYTRDDFRRFVLESPNGSSSRARIVETTTSADTATVDVEITQVSRDLFGGSSSHRALVTLRRLEGAWKITSDPSPWQFR